MARITRYKTIVVDPPWTGPGSSPAFDSAGPRLIPYATMTGIQLAALDVDGIAAEDAQLWLWTTSRNLCDAGLLAQLWAFKYRATFIWEKPGLGTGRHCRTQAEFLLWFARRGARAVDPKQCPRQIHAWPKPRRHSEKPAQAYDFIRSLSDPPRIDLFARQARNGFTPWGNQAPWPTTSPTSS